MSETKTLVELNPPTKLKLRIEEFDDFPTGIRSSRSPEYDEAIKAVLNASKSTISVEIEGKPVKQMYSTFYTKIKEFNSTPDRVFDLKQRTHENKVYLQKLPKGSLATKKPD